MTMTSTKKAWLTSVLSLLLCISMLIGSTFAWFTDSTTTGVNTIQAGKLDVVLEMWNGTEWVDAEGETLKFEDKDANELWEPGCTYTLQKIRVRNNGDIHLKYMIAITGIGGDAKLNEAIEWTANGADIATLGEDSNLAPNSISDEIIIQGHMKEEAGNEYQGLSIDHISITVYATQCSGESDSKDNTYDKDATYPVIVKDFEKTVSVLGKVDADNKLTEAVIIQDDVSGITSTLPASTLIEAGITDLTLKIIEDYVDNNVTLGITAGYDVTVEGVSASNTAPIVVYMPKVMPAEQTAIQLFHDGSLMERVSSIAEVSAASSQGVYGDRFYYDSENGDVTFALTHFSNVSIASSNTVTVNGVDLNGFTEINLHDESDDVTITSGQKVILTWDSGSEGTFNALTSNPIVAIFTNETPNPGNYFEHSIIVESGATVVLNGVSIRTADGEDALQVKAADGTTTTIYVADGTRNYLTGRSGIGIDGYSSGKSIVLEGGGFLQCTATSYACPGIGPADQSDGSPSITIDVGHLRAHPGKNAAGIGGGFVSNSWRGFSSITINGGIIQAYSGGNAAAIGSGNCGDTGSITVTAGKIYCYNQPWTANHHAMGAGTYAGTCNSISISANAYIYTNYYGVYDLTNDINTIKTSGFKATKVEFGVASEKFEKVFKNTDTYLYRVGNQDTVALGSLFSEISGVTVTDSSVAVTFETISGTASGTYTAASTWENGKIQFSGLGSVKVSITDGNYCKATELYLEVVNAKNVATGAEFYNDSGSIVLLCDLTLTTDILYGGTVYQKGTFSGNSALYGNGFTIQTAETYSSDVGLITLKDNATMDNVRIIVADHSDVWASNSGNPYNSAVKVESGNVTISNSYIKGGRSAVKLLGGTLTIDNTVINGGTFANLYVSENCTVELNLNNVTTAQYKNDSGKMGFGIMFDKGTVATLNITGTLNQYNWISETECDYFNFTYTDYSSSLKSIFSNNADQLSDGKMNLTIMWANNGGMTLNDKRTDKDNYGNLSLSLADSSGVTSTMYTYTPINSTVGEYGNGYTPNAQGIAKPDISYSFDTSKADDAESYIYYADSTLHIGIPSGGSISVDVNKATVNNGTITVTASGFTNGVKIFTDAETGTVTYTVVCKGIYDTKGNLLDTAKTFTYTLDYQAVVVEPDAKPAEFKFNSSSGTVTATGTSGAVYVMPEESSGDTFTTVTVDGITINAVKIETTASDSKREHTSAWNEYFYVFNNVVTITDYADSGAGAAITYNDNNSTFPTGLSLAAEMGETGGNVWTEATTAASIFKYQSSSSGTGPTYSNSKWYYSSPSISSSSGRSERTLYVKYKYIDNVGNTYYYVVAYYTPAQTYTSGGCVTPDTLITLADGTQKRVDELTAGEELLVWNFFTGEFDSAPLLFVDTHDGRSQIEDVVYLTFSDGTLLKVIYEHGLWDYTLNKYVYMDINASDYIGHWFDKSGEKIQLVSVEIKREETTVWTPVTAEHLCHYANGMLALAGGIDGMFNYFEVDPTTMKYDESAMQEDIEKYGLFTYEEFNEVAPIPEIMFDMTGCKYLKISIGKGLATVEDLQKLAKSHLDLFQN